MAVLPYDVLARILPSGTPWSYCDLQRMRLVSRDWARAIQSYRSLDCFLFREHRDSTPSTPRQLSEMRLHPFLEALPTPNHLLLVQPFALAALPLGQEYACWPPVRAIKIKHASGRCTSPVLNDRGVRIFDVVQRISISLANTTFGHPLGYSMVYLSNDPELVIKAQLRVRKRRRRASNEPTGAKQSTAFDALNRGNRKRKGVKAQSMCF